MTHRMMFVNLPVRDLERAKRFFGKLGFAFNPRFTDDKAACMVVSDVGYVMLIQEAFYRTFTRRDLCDTTRQEEGLVATAANGLPAFGQYRPGPAGGPHRPWSLVVLELSGDRIAAMIHFLDTATLFPRFGLPPELP